MRVSFVLSLSIVLPLTSAVAVPSPPLASSTVASETDVNTGLIEFGENMPFCLPVILTSNDWLTDVENAKTSSLLERSLGFLAKLVLAAIPTLVMTSHPYVFSLGRRCFSHVLTVAA